MAEELLLACFTFQNGFYNLSGCSKSGCARSEQFVPHTHPAPAQGIPEHGPGKDDIYLIKVKRLKHLLNVFVRCRTQVFQAKKLFELVEGELARRTLCHELLVPLVALGGAQLLHGFPVHVPHLHTKRWSLCSQKRGLWEI